jgi:capsule polysaccharide export protein KpsE/RkpR
MPQTYTAHTTILPPKEEGAMGISSFLRNLPIGGMGIGNVSDEANLFLAILNSRTMMESVVEKFDLVNRYKVKNIEKAILTLRDHVTFEITKEETITLSASATTKTFPTSAKREEARTTSRDMANFFIRRLDEINRQLKSEKARNDRLFIENRYHQNLEDLHRAEEAMKAFSQKNGAVALEAQIKAVIEVLAEMKARIISKEIDLKLQRSYLDETHPDYLRSKRELEEMNQKYAQIKRGSFDADDDLKNADVLLPIEKVPDLVTQYGRLLREFSLQMKLMEFLLPEYETAKIEEAKNTPTVQVLDEAVAPIKRSKPKRAIFVLLWGAVSLIITSAYAFGKEYLERLKNEDAQSHRQLSQLFSTVRRDFQRKKTRG